MVSMNKLFPIYFVLLVSTWPDADAQSPQISTKDIDHFWQAYDSLGTATNRADSILVIQKYYLDRATPYFKEFIRVRSFTAEEYVKLIAWAPNYWESARPVTQRIAGRTSEIQYVLDRFEKELPDFKIPNVCFAIGCLRTGGTTTRNLILIGSDIAAADSTIDKSELNSWLQSVMGNTGDIVAMIAHEAVHTRQKGTMKTTLLTASLNEGIADFITSEILGLNINEAIHAYGLANECELWREFREIMYGKDMNNWLYNGDRSKGRPADLGYFIGYRIAEEYYLKSHDKWKALENLLNRKMYLKIFQQSRYNGNCSD
jgi:hypothetical protein